MRKRIVAAFVLAVAAAVGVLGAGSAAAAGSGVTVRTVVSGLDNPRDLAIGPNGGLYVAEAGHGGTNCSPDGSTCVGRTSAITRINVDAGTKQRVVHGFVSVAGSDGSAATGVDGISFLGNAVYGIETASRQVVPPSGFPAPLLRAARNQLGRLIWANPTTGRWRIGRRCRRPRLGLVVASHEPGARPVPGREPVRRASAARRPMGR